MKLIKTLSLFAATSLILLTSISASEAAISASANAIHNTYFSTHHSETVSVDVMIKAGNKVDGACNYTVRGSGGSLDISSGISLAFPGDAIRDMLKSATYDCMQFVFISDNGPAYDNFDLVSNGSTYVDSTPHDAYVRIK